MLTVKIFLLVTLFLVISFASKETSYTRLSRISRLNDPDRSSSFGGAKKQEDEPRYFEQCDLVNVWKKQLGHVSVLAFLDPTWMYSFRQAVMLKLLSSRLRKSGLPDIRFFVITPPSDLAEDKIEDKIEIEHWRLIAANYETEDYVNTDDLLFKDTEAEVIVLQDDSRSRLWEMFRASKDQIVVIDRCGKLTYQIIVPWSILYFPYVKAAILATHEDDPCGGCDPTAYEALDYDEEYFRESLTSTAATETDARDNIDATDPTWTTDKPSSKNTSVHLEKSPREEHEASTTVSPVIFDKVTRDSDDPMNFSSMTEPPAMSAYRYDNDTTESPANETNSEETEDPINSQNSTTASETVATFELERNVGSAADETENEFISATETTISDFTDKIRDDDSNGESSGIGESPLSLRLIMYAPHLHRNGTRKKNHTHLILKIDDPEFHGHLDTGTDVKPSAASWRDTDDEATNSDREATEEDQKNTERMYKFDKDESPGFYGEIADYWVHENNNITNKNETKMLNNNTYNDSTNNGKHHVNISDQATTLLKFPETGGTYSIANVTTNTTINNSTNPPNTDTSDEIGSFESISTNDEVDKKKEMQNNLSEHYKKLLYWLDYRL